MQALIEFIARIIAPWQRQFINFIRIAIFIVMAWIGGLKAFQYEADGIAHFVSNSPFMSFFTITAINTHRTKKAKWLKNMFCTKTRKGKWFKKY
ncbi:Inner membrane protein ykgB [Rodentibacter pneumotropicus]|uniref:Inner membrane protein ykgB n=1 Tax=Rodentibacter pneumotropicus TaxID=758 RepID=A0A448MLE6_9PAST|nr:Inner membrane protein ykgB [Rodentibacter pneumotropicus]